MKEGIAVGDLVTGCHGFALFKESKMGIVIGKTKAEWGGPSSLSILCEDGVVRRHFNTALVEAINETG